MSPVVHRIALMAAVVAAAACADRPAPLEPAQIAQAAPRVAVSTLQARNERLARRFAIALRNDDFRGEVARALRSSTEPEGKVHLQRFLDGKLGGVLRQLAALAQETETTVKSDLDQSPSIEIYFPVPAHRRLWRGDLNLMVATAEHDRERPVAFDVHGRRHLLDAASPPTTPVLALGRAELTFREAAMPAFDGCFTCDPDGGGFIAGNSGGGTGGVIGGGASVVTPGLYMTYAKFNSTFEGWLKGDPEFEVHILGQDGTTSALKSYQCAGEKAGAPYQYDQNDKEWSGSVMLFSQTQLDTYKLQHPGQGVRVFVVEDDDGPCIIKTDSSRVRNLLQQIASTYGTLTGGKDTTLSSIKIFQKAQSLFQLIKTVWSLITTQDDVVGDAIEDVVAREYWPNANWIVKGENNITNGAIRLEMR